MTTNKWPKILAPVWRGVEPKEPIDVLLVAYGGGHIHSLLPVAKKLHESGYVVVILPLTTAISVVAESDFPYISYRDFGFSDWGRVKVEGARLAEALPSGGPVPHEETIAYLGANYLDLVQQYGTEKAKIIWDETGRQGFFPINTMRCLLQAIKPKLVVSTNSPRSERAVITAASDLSIPAVCLVDTFAPHTISWIKDAHFGTEVHVLSDAIKNSFVKNGRPSDHIYVTGNPAFDALFDDDVIKRGRELRSAKGWDSSKKVILFASTPEAQRHPFTGIKGDPKLPRVFEEKLQKYIKDKPDLELVIRRHPSEKLAPIQGANVQTSNQNEDISTLLHAVDCVVVTVSTVGLQAWMIGLPVVCVNFSIFSADAPFSKVGMAKGIDNWEELDDVLNGVLDNRTVPSQIEELATHKVCKRISFLLNKNL